MKTSPVYGGLVNVTVTHTDGTVTALRLYDEPRPMCCGVPVCGVCGGHDPLSGQEPVCHHDDQWGQQ